jgi:long-chain acyl-CoA synthetase
LIKGNSVFHGYFRNPELTASVLDSDGWLSTGDAATLLPNGSIKLIDRIKSLRKLQNGRFVALTNLENLYMQAPGISQIFITANWKAEAIVAVIVPEKDFVLRKLCRAE